MKKVLYKIIATTFVAGMTFAPTAVCMASNVSGLDNAEEFAQSLDDEGDEKLGEDEFILVEYDGETGDGDSLESGQTLIDEGDEEPEEGESVSVEYDGGTGDEDSLEPGQTLADEGDDEPGEGESISVEYDEKKDDEEYATATEDEIVLSDPEVVAVSTELNYGVDYASSEDKSLLGEYIVTENLRLRNGAGTSKPITIIMGKKSKVNCYGYYTNVGGIKWLLVQYVENGQVYTGFCSSQFLSK